MKKLVKSFMRLTGMQPTKEEFRQKLMAEEAKMGAAIFGKVPPNTHREFYQKDKRLWVWRESSQGVLGKTDVEIEYILAEDGVYKTNGQTGEYLKNDELYNFLAAVREYAYRARQLYSSY